MNQIQAWSEIFRLSHGNNWIPIPENLKRIVGLDSRIGIIGNTLCTKVSAMGAMSFLNRLNRIGEK